MIYYQRTTNTPLCLVRVYNKVKKYACQFPPQANPEPWPELGLPHLQAGHHHSHHRRGEVVVGRRGKRGDRGLTPTYSAAAA